MAKTATLRARVDVNQKAAAEAVLAKLGLSASDAINLFLNQIVIQNAIPFPITAQPRLDLTNATIEQIEERYAQKIPRPETQASLHEDVSENPRYNSSADLFKALNS